VKLSENFDADEFDCHDGSETPDEALANLHKLVITVLQPIRDVFGPLVVVSGYRSQGWNARVGGVSNSTHLTGEGVDVSPLRPSETQMLVDMVERMHSKGVIRDLGGFGKYRRWVHVDIRKAPDGHLRRWSGRSMGSEPT
jgi:uncharacterized protein YcbK (DUF882 family)